MKRKIMFVDDDAAVLAGLRNVLYRDCSRWDITFAHGPRAALAAIAEQTFDVVVADMRMPGIDGATLLDHVKAVSPRTGRVMLSGSADRAELERAIAAVDELLGKPCDARTLRATIERWLPRR